MSESSASVIEITDTKAAIFKGFFELFSIQLIFSKAFLEYVYLGKATLNEELALGLFEFSEKYMIDELKSNCEDFLQGALTVNNCFRIFEKASSLNEADSLKKKIMLFFQANIKEVSQSKNFENLTKETYINLRRMLWNDNIIFDLSFAKYMKNLQ